MSSERVSITSGEYQLIIRRIRAGGPLGGKWQAWIDGDDLGYEGTAGPNVFFNSRAEALIGITDWLDELTLAAGALSREAHRVSNPDD